MWWNRTEEELANAVYLENSHENGVVVVSVVAVVNSGVSRRVRMSRYLHQRDEFAKSCHVPHGTQSTDSDIRRRSLGQCAERHTMRLWCGAAWCVTAPSAERIPDAAGLVRECIWWWRLPGVACHYLLVHQTQNCRLWWWLMWCRLLILIEYSVVVITVTADDDVMELSEYMDNGCSWWLDWQIVCHCRNVVSGNCPFFFHVNPVLCFCDDEWLL